MFSPIPYLTEVKSALRQARTWASQAWVRLAAGLVLLASVRLYAGIFCSIRGGIQYHWESLEDEEAPNPTNSTAKERSEASRPSERRMPVYYPEWTKVYCWCADDSEPGKCQPAVRKVVTWNDEPENYGRFYHRCAKSVCKFRQWETLPDTHRHWQWLLGRELKPTTGSFEREVDQCDHPIEKLQGMGGCEAAVRCQQCGGRWEKGPRAHMSRQRARTFQRLSAEGMEEVFGKLNPKAAEEIWAKPTTHITNAQCSGTHPSARSSPQEGAVEPKDVPIPPDSKKRGRREYEGHGWWPGEDGR